MKKIACCMLLCFPLMVWAQTVKESLTNAMDRLQKDAQFKHAAISLYVVESKTGKLVFEKNAEMGLVPASCQKVITSVSALAMLGKDFRYRTSLSVAMPSTVSEDKGMIFINGNGNPTLGSNRYTSSQPSIIFERWGSALKKAGVQNFSGILCIDDVSGFGEMSMLPKGYVWEDIGNYYGANSWLINWRENQYEVQFKKGETNRSAVIKSVYPAIPNLKFINRIKIGEIGSGDNAYIYCAPYADTAYLTGTIPPAKEGFAISGSMPHPALVLGNEFKKFMKDKGIVTDSCTIVTRGNWPVYDSEKFAMEIAESIHYSPSLDSINFWFLKKSVNLYGETLLKSIGMLKRNDFATQNGVDAIRDFWSKNGIEKSAINIIDGSGLSPANRVTSKALVTVLQFAKQQPWFASFYTALPEMNGIKMKDGYIGGVRAYTGFTKNKKGMEYAFSFIANNFDGSAATAREKMYALLDLLK